ncbi:MAG TPA: hypothetical protein VK399_15550 [Longimicrobiaceae bacterium]|nr:hypothetical protein [Longimicrobiaceae bacterium]
MPGCCDGATGVAVLRAVCGGMASVPGVACRGPERAAAEYVAAALDPARP